MWPTIYQEKTMTPQIRIETTPDLQGWPNHWPPPCKFLGPSTFNITSLKFKSSLTETQAVIRFKNQYGVRITENFFHEGLFLVAILKFYGPHDGDFDLVHDSSFPDLTWYFTGHEVFSLSERVAQWDRPPGHPNTRPAK